MKKKCRKKAAKDKEVLREGTCIENKKQQELCRIPFKAYIGQTVTVYVNAGGAAGNGFTGVLMAHEDTYIKLLVRPSAPPECALGNSCSGREQNPLFCIFCPHADTLSLGTMVEIPMTAIAAFVHHLKPTRDEF